MTARILLLAALLLVPAAARADRVDDYVKTQMARNHIPAASVAVVRDGQVLKQKAYGQANLEWGAAATPDTLYQLASATKPLTGTALMLLVQDGKLSLDDRISRFLPDVPPAWRDITVRHLATHTSGIPDDLGTAPVHTAANAVASAEKLPLDHAPGARASYGITGYMVLMHLMERVAGKPFPQLLKERVFQPLGMDGTRFDNAAEEGPVQSGDVLPHRASVYEWNGKEQRAFSFLFPAHSYSAGGLYSSAADLARWTRALDTGRLLDTPHLQQMWAPQKLADGTSGGFAVGWAVGKYHGRRTVGHSGGPALADILRFPDEKLTIIVLANQERLFPYLAQGVADLYVPAPQLSEEAVTDRSPEVTAGLKELLIGLGAEKIDRSRFTVEAQQRLLPAIEQFGMPLFRSLEALRALMLLSDEERDGRRVRRYRAWYGKKPVLWRFELDSQGKIAAMEPTPE